MLDEKVNAFLSKGRRAWVLKQSFEKRLGKALCAVVTGSRENEDQDKKAGRIATELTCLGHFGIRMEGKEEEEVEMKDTIQLSRTISSAQRNFLLFPPAFY